VEERLFVFYTASTGVPPFPLVGGFNKIVTTFLYQMASKRHCGSAGIERSKVSIPSLKIYSNKSRRFKMNVRMSLLTVESIALVLSERRKRSSKKCAIVQSYHLKKRPLLASLVIYMDFQKLGLPQTYSSGRRVFCCFDCRQRISSQNHSAHIVSLDTRSQKVS
jgi:hypothetical protein